MIVLENVSKQFKLRGGGHKTILSNVSIKLPDKNLAILGPNGAGKSTTLRMISGVENVDSGRVIHQLDMSWPIGFRGSFHKMLTGVENVRFVARMYGRNTEYVVEYVKEFAELGSFFYEPIRTYSSGMMARLGFGTSMAIDFDCYLVDELMSVGDASFRQKSKKVFKQKLKKSRLIMVSHSMKDLKTFCDSGILLTNGTMTYFENIDDAISEYEKMVKKPKKQGNKHKQSK
ncbi:MAG: ABC transporter ATP-binding protein [Pseudomonadota bacterium]